MQRKSTFFRLFRGLWVGVNVASLIVSTAGYRDLSGLIFTLSFPANVVPG